MFTSGAHFLVILPLATKFGVFNQVLRKHTLSVPIESSAHTHQPLHHCDQVEPSKSEKAQH